MSHSSNLLVAQGFILALTVAFGSSSVSSKIGKSTTLLAMDETEFLRSQKHGRIPTKFQQRNFSDVTPLIVGGSPTNNSEYPYYCLLLTFDIFSNVGQCGCSIIHDDMILSAAHCFVDRSDEIIGVDILAGHIEVSDETIFYQERVSANNVWWPSAYNPDNVDFDFMIMQLDRALPFDKVQLNKQRNIPTIGEVVTATGFGRKSTANPELPNTLMEVDLIVQSPSVCATFLAYNDETMLCANAFEKGVCSGDSGGPLILRTGSPPSDVQVGITSFGSVLGCADEAPTAPDVFSRVGFWYDTVAFLVCSESAYKSPTFQCEQTEHTPLPSHSPTTHPTNLPTSEPTTTVPNGGQRACIDDPSGWTDSAGDGCSWYSEENRCNTYGHRFENLGFTANQACCTCGGGKSITAPPPNGGECMEKPSGWTDSVGDGCEWYTIEDRCENFGNFFENMGFTANQACCVCGGGEEASEDLPELSWGGYEGCSTKAPCGECEGDCDFDADCAGDLRCFLRSEVVPVPGCRGVGISGGDYCYDASASPDTSAPTPIPNREPSSHPTLRPTWWPTSFPTSSPTVFPTPKPTASPTSEPTVSPTSSLSARPTGTPSITKPLKPAVCNDYPLGWIDAFGNACSWYSQQKDRCPKYGTSTEHQNNGLNAAGACCVCGGGVPDSSSNLLPWLSWEGWEGCSSLKPCGECEGHCKSNEDCLGNLQCFPRSSRETVHGCRGLGIVRGGYCHRLAETMKEKEHDEMEILSLSWNGWDGCTAEKPCLRCEGDCDADEECEGSLRCVKLNSPTVAGCFGAVVVGGDYCA